MFDATIDRLENDRATRYRITRDSAPLSYSQVLDLWCSEEEFRSYFTALLASSPFTAYRWETPALTLATASHPFEFVLLNSSAFHARQADAAPYGDYFTSDDTSHGIVTFPNLGGDAGLIVPSPRTTHAAYGHLGAFLRLAPAPQVDAFWRVIGMTVKGRISDRPLWLSTAGGGVAWLHVRLDLRPKYYAHAAYRRAPGWGHY